MTEQPEVDWSVIFGALADAERRTILRRLTDAPNGSVSVGELAGELAGTATDNAADRKNGELRLRHVHLPKLEQSGLVHKAGDTATATPMTTQLPQWVFDPTGIGPPEQFRAETERTGAEAGSDD